MSENADIKASSDIMHHGSCKGEFEPRYIGTDYFKFQHQPCLLKPPLYGNVRVTHVLIDTQGRIIFNLQCRSCGATDVLKTHPFLHMLKPKPLPYRRIFHFSPALKKCVHRNRWDSA